MPATALHAVRDRVASGWSQGAHARDRFGTEVALGNDQAVAWTLCAAFALVGKDGIPMDRIPGAIRALSDVTSIESLTIWNDDPSRTQQEVLDALDRAIERVEGVDEHG